MKENGYQTKDALIEKNKNKNESRIQRTRTDPTKCMDVKLLLSYSSVNVYFAHKCWLLFQVACLQRKETANAITIHLCLFPGVKEILVRSTSPWLLLVSYPSYLFDIIFFPLHLRINRRLYSTRKSVIDSYCLKLFSVNSCSFVGVIELKNAACTKIRP